ncbi:hypothetical protein SBA4_7670004 [Candidatus Sulfopaludibacter sp. SbA4]|nr:hypothetical protein SBA4_7670004 [Candidatus Sulfopaludibacter sp. SbA4]
MPRTRNVPPRRPALRRKSKGRRGTARDGVFLNVPYDSAFADLFLAYIAGVAAFDLEPRATLEIVGGERRLDRTFELIERCRYSVHDLSRVEVDARRPTPRFNMPFELGLAVAWSALTLGSTPGSSSRRKRTGSKSR